MNSSSLLLFLSTYISLISMLYFIRLTVNFTVIQLVKRKKRKKSAKFIDLKHEFVMAVTRKKHLPSSFFIYFGFLVFYSLEIFLA